MSERTPEGEVRSGEGSAAELPADGTLLTARGVRSRAALLRAARSLFEEKGYANTTIAEIAREAGRATGSFYTYFDNKEALLEQLAEDFEKDITSHMAAVDMARADPYELIRELCAVTWRVYRERSAEITAMFQAAMQNEHFNRRWAAIRSRGRRKIAATLAAFERNGLVRAANPYPEAMASAIGSMITEFCHLWLIEGGETDAASLDDDVAIETMARIFYRSVFAAPEPPAAASVTDSIRPSASS